MAQRRVTDARIATVVRGAMRAGLTVCSVEVTKDGVVRVVTHGQTAPAAANDVDDWFDGKPT